MLTVPDRLDERAMKITFDNTRKFFCAVALLMSNYSAEAGAPPWQGMLSPAHQAKMKIAEGRLDDLPYWRDMARQELAGSEKPLPGDQLFDILVNKPAPPLQAGTIGGNWKLPDIACRKQCPESFPLFQLPHQ
jgi:hypothetical protein